MDRSEIVTSRRAFIIDMDGVLYHGDHLLPGAKDFVAWLESTNRRYLFLTNSSARSPKEISARLERLGLKVGEEHFFTSALATATFLARARPNGTCYVIGEPGLMGALYDAGYSMSDLSPDYVVIGETRSMNYEMLEKAVRLVLGGARLIGTNPDPTGPTERGIVPACGSICALVERATGRQTYYCGKPNPLMMRSALKRLQATREETAIIGDRMDTDMIAGIETDIETVLVLSGVTRREDISAFAYSPRHVLEGVFEIPD
jgi:NagD protein